MTHPLITLGQSVLATLCIGACSLGHSHTHQVVGKGSLVTVANVDDETESLLLAGHYCETLGKTAQKKSVITHRWRHRSSLVAEFECVPN